MLVLSRKRSEGIVINENIEVFVVEIQRDRVLLGIIAPREIPVHRKEIHDKIQAEKVKNGTEANREKA